MRATTRGNPVDLPSSSGTRYRWRPPGCRASSLRRLRPQRPEPSQAPPILQPAGRNQGPYLARCPPAASLDAPAFSQDCRDLPKGRRLRAEKSSRPAPRREMQERERVVEKMRREKPEKERSRHVLEENEFEVAVAVVDVRLAQRSDRSVALVIHASRRHEHAGVAGEPRSKAQIRILEDQEEGLVA